MSSDEWIAYLSGDNDVALGPGERAEADELASLLADPALWVEPDPALEDRVVAAVAGDAVPIARRRSRRLTYSLLGLAAAVLLAVGIALPLTNNGTDNSVVFAATLTGTPLAPRASGQVTLTQTTSGWRIHLTATGLPRRAGSGYYEAWLKNSAGVLVPIGTFNQATDVTLWAGVPPTSFATLTVTRQQANGDPASSGQVVLVGVTTRKH